MPPATARTDVEGQVTDVEDQVWQTDTNSAESLDFAGLPLRSCPFVKLPSSSVDVTGSAHVNTDGAKIPTPHVHEAGQKNVRPATPDELPGETDG